jgi:hypothetical protein
MGSECFAASAAEKEIVMQRFIMALIALFVWCRANQAQAASPLVFIPFPFGEQWKCSQGPGGSYSHVGSLNQAYDFNLPDTKDNGKPIYSPVAGTVVEVVKTANNICGSSSGWGNYVIIQDSTSGKFVRIAHMIVNSVAVNKWDSVQIGTFIGNVGCTGFSTGPHLHIQVQNSQTGESVPFRFIEGTMTCNNSVDHTSQLIPKASLIDNLGETNLGHRLSSTGTYSWGWSSSVGAPGYVSSDYYIHQRTSADSSYFIWAFQVKNPGWYQLYANWVAHSNRDPCVSYILWRNGSFYYQSGCINQTVGNGKVNFKPILSNTYLYPGDIYELEVRGMTVGKYTVADAIVIAGGP